MGEKITFRTRIEFEGSIAQFEEVGAALAELPIGLRPEFAQDDDPTGVWTHPPEFVLGRDVLEQLAEGKPRAKLAKGIAGGIQDCHFHLGDEAVLLDRAEFKKFVGQVAMRMAEKLAERADYTETVRAVDSLLPGRSA